MARRTLAVLACVTAALASGCSAWPLITAPRLGSCPGPLVSTERLAGDFTARHSARITAREFDLALSLVVEKRADRLLLVGFGALGAKRFAVIQRGAEVEVEYFGPRPGVPAENVLRDLHRVHFAASLDERAPESQAVSVESGRSPQGQPTTRIENPACGYAATYVTLSEERRP